MLSRKIFLCRLAPPFPSPFPPGEGRVEVSRARGEAEGREGERGHGRKASKRTFSSSGHVDESVCGGV
jgi:hypothetical protein